MGNYCCNCHIGNFSNHATLNSKENIGLMLISTVASFIAHSCFLIFGPVRLWISKKFGFAVDAFTHLPQIPPRIIVPGLAEFLGFLGTHNLFQYIVFAL